MYCSKKRSWPKSDSVSNKLTDFLFSFFSVGLSVSYLLNMVQWTSSYEFRSPVVGLVTETES